MRAWSLPLSVVVALAQGCFFDASVPGEHEGAVPVIQCSNADECPPEWVCREGLGRCVPPHLLDEELPRVLDAVVSPELGGLDVTFELALHLSPAPLLQAPQAFVDAGWRKAPLRLTSSDDEAHRYRLTYRPDPADEQGARPITVRLVAAKGDIVEAPGGVVIVDFAPPVVTGSSLEPARASQGQTIVAEGGFNEAVAAVEVRMRPSSDETNVIAWQAAPADDDASFRFSYTPAGDEPQGPWDVELLATDGAGNSMAPLSLGEVSLDFDAPAVDLIGVPIALPPTTSDRTVTVGLKLTEVPAAAPLVRAYRTADPTESVAFAQIGTGGIAWTFAGAFESAASEGEYEIRVGALSDAAGNVGVEVTTHTILLDRTPPTLSSFAPVAASFTGSETLVVTFDADEELSVAPVVKVGSTALARDESVAAPAHRYTLDLATTTLSGTYAIEVALEDLAHNISVDRYGLLDVDARGAELFDAFFSPSAARLGSLVLLTLFADEELAPDPAGTGGAPLVTLQWDGAGDPGLTFLARSGLTYTWGLTVDATVADGTYDLTGVVLTDLAGNVSALDLASALGAAPSLVVDSTPPVIDGVALNAARRSAQPGFDGVQLTFDSDSDFSASGAALSVTLAGRALFCGAYSTTTPSYTCATTVVSTDPEGFQVVVLEARDGAGNLKTASAGLVIDFTAPAIVPGSEALQLVAAGDNVLSTVDAARVGTLARLSFTASELLGTTPIVEATTPTPLAFSQANAAGVSFVFEHVVAGTPTDGDHAIFVTLADDVGNTSDPLPIAPRLRVDTTPPAAPHTDVAAAFVLERRPWGADDSGGDVRLDVAVAPGGVDEAGTLIVYSAATPPRSELGRLGFDPALGSASISLIPSDRPVVYVAHVDGAGNESAAARVREGEWVATMGLKVAGDTVDNPHFAQERVLSTPHADQVLDFAGGTVTELGSDELSRVDGNLVTTLGSGELAQRVDWGRIAIAPPAKPLAVARDARSGTFIAVLSDATPDVTWRWDESRWRVVRPADPEGDGNPATSFEAAAAFDGRRGKIVLFGGGASDTGVWEWDGASWELVTPLDPEGDTDPSPRNAPSLGYDPARQRVLLFGGMSYDPLPPTYTNDLWAWDGASWEQLSPDAPADGSVPPPRKDAHVVVDEAREQLVVYGGSDGAAQLTDLWEWDGSAWTGFAGPSASFTARPSAAWDPIRDKALFYWPCVSGAPLCTDGGVWTWDGAQWEQLPIDDPEGDGAPNTSRNLSFDPLTGDMLLFVVYASGVLPLIDHRVWRWRRATDSFQQLSPRVVFGGSGPSDLIDFAMTYDEARGVVLIHGGNRLTWQAPGIVPPLKIATTDELWAWDGRAWRLITPDDTAGDGDPGAAVNHAMAFDGARDVVWLLRGADLWSWDGTSFTPAAPLGPDRPPSMVRHAMAYDVARDRVVVFGGESAAAAVDNVWEWDGSRWREVAATDPELDGGPAGTSRVGLAYDAARGVTVLFGGVTAAGPSNATWEWNGTSWRRAATTDPEGDGDPSPRERPALLFDPASSLVHLFGGLDDDGAMLGDLWTFGGESWRRSPVPQPRGSSRPASLLMPAAAFDALRGVVVVHGLASIPFSQRASGVMETWEWAPSARRPPSHVFRVDVGAAKLAPAALLERVDVRFVSGGSGYAADDTAVDGVVLEAWSNQDFVSLATSTAPAGAPADVAYSTTSLDEVARWELDGELLFQVRSLDGSSALRRATLTTDYAEARIRYREP